MHITHVITTIELGGAEKQLLILAREQVKKNHDVRVIYLKGQPELSNEFNSCGARIAGYLANRNFLIQVLMFFLSERKYGGVFHFHLPRAELFSLVPIKNATRVLTKHNIELFFQKFGEKISNILSRSTASQSNSVIAISQSVKNFLRQKKEVSRETKINVVYYGFDPCINDGPTLSNLSVKESKQIIGTVSRLEEQKDLPTLLRGFERLSAINSNLDLKIVGEGSEKFKLIDLAQQLGIESRVEFIGKTKNIMGFLQGLDLFVLTSRYEGFGLVLLEAMQARVPIVAADNSAVTEVLNSHKESLFPTGDYIALSEILQKALKSDYANKLVTFQTTQLDRFSPIKMAENIENVYFESKVS
jgi:glycosyltransferase involved in cell wall biosynthesis